MTQHDLRSHQIERIQQLQACYEIVEQEPESIYYPRCGTDASPWLATPHAHITGVDTDESAVSVLRSNVGDTVLVGDVEAGQHCEPADVVLNLDGVFDLNQIKRHLKPEGYVICGVLWQLGLIAGQSDTEINVAGTVSCSNNEIDTGSSHSNPCKEPFSEVDLIRSFFHRGLHYAEARIRHEHNLRTNAGYTQNLSKLYVIRFRR